MTTPTKLQRWLDIIAYLVGRRLPVSVDELMRNVPAYAERWQSDNATERASARRGFERDKDELRRLGIPIRTVEYSTADHPDVLEGYLLDRRDFYLPYLQIVQEAAGPARFRDRFRHDTIDVAEADAPLALEALRRVVSVPGFPLAREARSAFRKLAFDLDPQHFSDDTPVLFMEPPGTAEMSERLRVLSDALLARRSVAFRYHGMYRDDVTDRQVNTYGLLFQQGQWYLIGFDDTRSDIRVFRVSRMAEVRRMSADYTIPADFDLRGYVGRRAWELGEGDTAPIVARVLFRFPLSLWAARNNHGVHESRRTDGGEVRCFEVQQAEPFLRWVLSLGGEAELLEPSNMKDELHRMLLDVAHAHGDA